MNLVTLGGLIALALIAAVGIEAYLRRNRKRRSFVETFKGSDGTGDEGVPLGMEATDFDILIEEERKAYHTGMTNQTRAVKRIRKK